MPCHYVNVFTPGVIDLNEKDEIQNIDCDGHVLGESLIGGTAFVHGSHYLSVCARLTAKKHHENKVGRNMTAQEELHLRLIQSHFQVGDVLLFDCRLLHLGLANQYPLAGEKETNHKGRRAMIYMSMTHVWFHDPKNWNDKKSMF